MLLNELHPGQRFRIKKLIAIREIGRRLADMGFVVGTEGKLLRVAHFGDPIEVSILDYNISIRKSEAMGVEVELLSEDTVSN